MNRIKPFLPSVLLLTLAVFLAAGIFPAAAWAVEQEMGWYDPFEYEAQEQWYDPAGWFFEGNRLDGSDWLAGFSEEPLPRGRAYGYYGDTRYDRRRQMQRDPFDPRWQQQRDRFEPRAQMQQPARSSGDIEALKTVTVTDTGERHMLAKLRTQAGRDVVVDLGPIATLRDLELQKGDRLMVMAAPGTINERNVLMAQRIRAKGRTMNISRQRDLDLTRYQGTILGVREFPVAGGAPDAQQVVARIRLRDGATTVVNLGASEDLQDMELSRGQQIDILARPVMIDGRRALVARQFRTDGQTFDVNWTKARMQLQGRGYFEDRF